MLDFETQKDIAELSIKIDKLMKALQTIKTLQAIDQQLETLLSQRIDNMDRKIHKDE